MPVGVRVFGAWDVGFGVVWGGSGSRAIRLDPKHSNPSRFGFGFGLF